MKPGTDFLHPEMGIDIVGRYRYSEENDMDDLQEEINNQVTTYFPNYNTVSVSANFEGANIITKINIDDTLYTFSSNDSEVKSLDSLLDNTEIPEDGEDIFEDGYSKAENFEEQLFASIPFFSDVQEPPEDPI